MTCDVEALLLIKKKRNVRYTLYDNKRRFALRNNIINCNCANDYVNIIISVFNR